MMSKPQTLSTIIAVIVTVVAASSLALGAYLSQAQGDIEFMQLSAQKRYAKTQMTQDQPSARSPHMAEIPTVGVPVETEPITFFGVTVE